MQGFHFALRAVADRHLQGIVTLCHWQRIAVITVSTVQHILLQGRKQRLFSIGYKQAVQLALPGQPVKKRPPLPPHTRQQGVAVLRQLQAQIVRINGIGQLQRAAHIAPEFGARVEREQADIHALGQFFKQIEIHRRKIGDTEQRNALRQRLRQTGVLQQIG